ncbi:hypothetical protein L596_017817 [Steinernema carpocapsae]|uniref:Uncharacterized protein n=1 Tax=Steinernema carpocapsae TaxID=34508 RepID=A0A4U5N3K2_STECR|nr:hypothetical protein L596_017817 [Steinernema carpocapsae]
MKPTLKSNGMLKKPRIEDRFSENAGSLKLQQQLKKLTAASKFTDTEGLIEREEVEGQTDFRIAPFLEMPDDDAASGDPDLPVLPIEEDENLPPRTVDETFWLETTTALERRIAEVNADNEKIRRIIGEKRTREEAMKARKDGKLAELEARIEAAKVEARKQRKKVEEEENQGKS